MTKSLTYVEIDIPEFAIVPPPPAAEHGFTTLIISDDFDDSSTIDADYTGAGGFNWYPHPWFCVQNVVPASFAVAGSKLTLIGGQPDTANDHPNMYRPRIASAGLIGFTTDERLSSTTNLLTAPWVEVQNGGAVAAGTILTSLGAGSAPDAVGTAYRMALGGTGSNWSGLQQTFATSAASGPYSGSQAIWARSSPSGGAANIRFVTTNTVNFNTGSSQRFPLTSAWKRFSKTMWFANPLIPGVTNQNNAALIFGNQNMDGSAVDQSCNGNVDIYLPSMLAATPSVVGTEIAPTGGYFEIRCAFDPSLAEGPAQQGWPTFWMQQKLGLQAQSMNVGLTSFNEFDFLETIPDAVASVDIQKNQHQWTTTLGGGFGNRFSQSIMISPASIGAPTLDNTTFHTWAVLWLTMAQNGGTGLLRTYFDGVAYPEHDITYTSGSQWEIAETGGNYIMILDGGPAMPLIIDVVRVWQ